MDLEGAAALVGGDAEGVGGVGQGDAVGDQRVQGDALHPELAEATPAATPAS